MYYVVKKISFSNVHSVSNFSFREQNFFNLIEIFYLGKKE